jgi:indole-3-glycerol phosphate synthase
MHGERRFSQAIAEGDGISLVAEADDSASAARAAADGARALSARAPLGDVDPRLPVLWRGGGRPEEAHQAGADAWVLVAAAADDDDRLQDLYTQVLDLGLDCVVEVADEEELERVLERIDPEVFLLTGRRGEREDDWLEHVLELLEDVPAGKLAVADLERVDGDTLAQLERAGVDAVIVPAGELAELPHA